MQSWAGGRHWGFSEGWAGMCPHLPGALVEQGSCSHAAHVPPKLWARGISTYTYYTYVESLVGRASCQSGSDAPWFLCPVDVWSLELQSSENHHDSAFVPLPFTFFDPGPKTGCLATGWLKGR